MAMPPGSVTPSDKSQFPPSSVAGTWFPDGRDEFISWIRGEFAAANAMIDSLCHHLTAIGDHNEYEDVISSIQHRKSYWSQVLYMQPFYTVEEVSYTLQQVAWKKRQQQKMHHPQRHYSSDQAARFGGGRRSGFGFNKHHHHGGGDGGGDRGSDSMARNGHLSDLDRHSVKEAKFASDDEALSVAEEKRDGREKPKSDSKDLEESESAGAGIKAEKVNHICNSASKNNSLSSEQKQDKEDKECPATIAKTFVAEEVYEAKMVNVVEGLKLYDKMLDANEVSEVVSLANDLRIAGRRGQLQSQSYVGYKRPNRGRGREMIQLGLAIADMSPYIESTKDRRIEPIPSVLSDIIERFVSKQIIPVKPDACIIDFFNEGDHSQPHMFVPWFGRPVSVLSLSECDFTFGRVIVSDHPGDYNGCLKLSLTPGSVFRVEGNSADLAKFAIHPTRKQRILVTFIKSQPRNSITGSNRGPLPSRSPNHHIPHTTNGVLPTPSHRPSNRAVQPIVIAPSLPYAPPMQFPNGGPPEQTSWALPHHPRHQPPPQQPRMPLSGTGVYLPHGSTQELVLHGPPEISNSSSGSNSTEGGSSDSKRKEEEEEEACNGVAADECDDDRGSGDGKERN